MKALFTLFPRKIGLGVLLLLIAPGGNLFALEMTGHNGQRVAFAGILEAHAGGLRLKVTLDGPLIDVPWDRFDAEALRIEHPIIESARLRTQGSNRIAPIKTGIFQNVLSPVEAIHEINAVLHIVPIPLGQARLRYHGPYVSQTLLDLLKEIEGVGLNEKRRREQLFRIFSDTLRNGVLPHLKRVESQVPNVAFCERMDRYLFVVPRRLARFNETLEEILRSGEISDSHRAQLSNFFRYLEAQLQAYPLADL